MNSVYKHTEEIHNLDAASVIVPILVDLIKPANVIDVGCGLGTFLKVFKDNGVSEVLGLDGQWCEKELLFKNITPQEFIETDLRYPIKLGRRFDLVLCLEVAEHLPPELADKLISELVSLGDVILFSSAIPDQWGDNHINEQWMDYWESKFITHRFIIHDILKPRFWNNKSIFWWYSQNMVLFTKEEYKFKSTIQLTPNLLRNVVHPDLFASRNKYLNDIIHGKSSTKYYLNLLLKSILYKAGLKKK